MRSDQTLSADGNTTALSYDGGTSYLAIEGTFGGGTAKGQVSFDGGTTYHDISGTSQTSDGYASFAAPAGCLVRVNLAGATTPSLNIRWR